MIDADLLDMSEKEIEQVVRDMSDVELVDLQRDLENAADQIELFREHVASEFQFRENRDEVEA